MLSVRFLFCRSEAKVRGDLVHALHLLDVEGAAALAVAAVQTVAGVEVKVCIVLLGSLSPVQARS